MLIIGNVGNGAGNGSPFPFKFFLIVRIARIFTESTVIGSAKPSGSDVARVDSLHNPVAHAGSQNANEERLQSTVKPGSLRPDRDVILDEAEYEQDHDCDTDRDEESVRDILHGEVRNHWNEST